DRGVVGVVHVDAARRAAVVLPDGLGRVHPGHVEVPGRLAAALGDRAAPLDVAVPVDPLRAGVVVPGEVGVALVPGDVALRVEPVGDAGRAVDGAVRRGDGLALVSLDVDGPAVAERLHEAVDEVVADRVVAVDVGGVVGVVDVVDVALDHAGGD